MAEENAAVQNAEAPAESKRTKNKNTRQVLSGIVHINSTFNNTRVVVTDMQGNVLSWCTGGKQQLKGSRKATAFAATEIAKEAVTKARMTYGLKEVEVEVKGPGAGRESAVRGIAAAQVEISVLRDVTPLPHNGCRPPKRRRV